MKFILNKQQLLIVSYILLLVCAAFALSYPMAFRMMNSQQIFVGEKSYDTLLSINSIQEYPNPLEPNSWIHSNQKVHTPFQISNYLYALLLSILPSSLLPVFFSLITLTVVWFMLSTFEMSLSTRFIASCMLAFSPLFIITQLSLNSASFLFLFLILLIFALRSHWNPFICAAIAFFAGLFGIDAILPLILILVLTTQKSGHAPIVEHKRYSLFASALGLLVWLVLIIVTDVSLYSFFNSNLFDNFLIDFGSQYGQTILLLILALIGATNTWKKELRWHFVGALALLFWSSFFPNASLLTTAVLSYLAGLAFTKIWSLKWNYVSLKSIVLMCILAAVIANYFIFSHQLIQSQPDSIAINAYEFIEKNTPSDSVIFSLPLESATLSYFSNRDVINTNNDMFGIYASRNLDTQKILYSKSLSYVLTDLKDLGVTHVLINYQLQSGDLWREDKGGLALLLRNKRAFELMYDNGYRLYHINYDLAQR